MILGRISIDTERRTLDTHRDSYLLDMLTVVSVRRPFVLAAAAFATGLGAFAVAFADLLFPHEIAAIIGGCLGMLIAGWQVGQLKLLSRDLRGSELSDAIWGRYARLNAARRQITKAMTMRTKEQS